MAQVLAVRGDVRHGFCYNRSFNHDFGRITGIAATKTGNILLSDYDYKNLILVDALGNFLKKLNVESAPYDVAVTNQNIGFITLPKSRSVLQIDPDRMVILFEATCDDLNTNVFCVSAIPNIVEDIKMSSLACFLGVKQRGLLFAIPFHNGYDEEFKLKDFPGTSGINGYTFPMNSRVVKFHALAETSFFSCRGGQNYITYSHHQGLQRNISISTVDTPTDICSDDNEHLYVSGQGSNNIHRLRKEGFLFDDSYGIANNAHDWKVLDIPLDFQHGIKEPVAVCFNQNYSKFYVVNEWGKSVLVFDVV